MCEMIIVKIITKHDSLYLPYLGIIWMLQPTQKHLCWILFLIILEASRLLLYLKEFLIWNTYLLEYLQITASLERASYFTINRFSIKLVRITFMYQRVPVLILQWKWGMFRGSASVREKNYTHVKMGHTSELPLGIYW